MSIVTPTILIVDDLADNVMIVKHLLGNEGYALKAATSGRDALDILAAGGVDMILLDVMMPGMDGFEVCRRVKADPALWDIPVIFLTAKTDQDALLEGFRLGGADYVTKPFDPSELMARVRTHLRLRRTEEELRGLLANKDRLLGIIAQDLRTPFAALEEMLKLLSREHTTLAPEEVTDYLQSAGNTAYALRGMLDNLLAWSQFKIGQLGFNPRRLAASELIDAALQLEADALATKEIRVTVTAPAGIDIQADPELAKMILSRIICNAAKFSRRGGQVEISALRADDKVTLEVKDHGVGISEADRQMLFRGNPPLRRVGTEGEIGLGMGLSLAKDLAEEHGGGLELESAPGQGTRVSVMLPAA